MPKVLTEYAAHSHPNCRPSFMHSLPVPPSADPGHEIQRAGAGANNREDRSHNQRLYR
ncbi:hypothetical protein GCM10010260_71260 [Streptomyces filipinensis]|uniref:Uncharacterized protein n=1 Tax=Streptomyces filipinensis TaxID=66887 RepID=A0A918IIA9_9ACTN|nr:hypothetical protein GCM10010260_71260 [Streptomyces filipinensis]